MDDGKRLWIRDCSLCAFKARFYDLPEAFNIHRPRYTNTTLIGFGHQRPPYLPSFLFVPAMRSISYDVDLPPLALTVIELYQWVHYSFEEDSYSDWIMQRWTFCETIDLVVGMSEKQEEVIKHLAQVLGNYRRLREACSRQQGLLDFSRR